MPSAYTKGLKPVASADVRVPTTPKAKMNLDFESALRTEGTVRLREGPDVATLGVVDASPVSSPRRRTPPAGTLVVVPPTPESRPHLMSSNGTGLGITAVVTPTSRSNKFNANMPSPLEPSPQRELNEAELQNKRRSMFRSPGTASSPDLATLLRKAKEREGGHGGIVGGLPSSAQPEAHESANADGNAGAGLLSPNQNSRLRGSSSTSSFSVVSAGSAAAPRTPMKGTPVDGLKRSPVPGNRSGEADVPPGSEVSGKGEWTMTSPRARSGSKSGKSMRMRATNFFGKMLGQDTNSKDKSRTDASSTPTTPVSSDPPLYSRFTNNAPPVPQLPQLFRSHEIPPPSPAEVFYTAPNTPNCSKTLPVEPTDIRISSEQQASAAGAHTPSTPTLDRTITPREDRSRRQGSTSSLLRRSVSVGDLNQQKSTVNAADSPPAPHETSHTAELGKTSTEWDTSGILKMFKGELSQLDPISSTSLEITDPSITPQRPSLSYSRTHATQAAPSHTESAPTIRPRPSGSSRPTAPTITTMTEKLYTGVGSPAGKWSPTSSTQRSPVNNPDSPIRSAKRISSRLTPALASGLYGSPRTTSTPMLGTLPSPVKGRNNTVPSFSNPFTQPSVVVNGVNATSPRDSIHSPASYSEPVLPPDDGVELGLRRRSQPHTDVPDPNRTVRLVPSATSFPYPVNGHASGSGSQVDIGIDVSPVKAMASSSFSPTRDVSLEGDEIEARGQALAKRCWLDDESFLSKDKIAEWLGGAARINAVALRHYVDFYDFTGLRLDHAFRRFCGKLYLKGETQQIDRILAEFSRRYFECNPSNLCGSASVVHAVAYSILLLNTDLHIADLSAHMSRTQFVRNTVQAIQAQIRSGPSLARASTPDLTYDDGSSAHARSEGSESGVNTLRTRPKRSSSVHSWTSVSREVLSSVGASTGQATSPIGPPSHNASTASVQTPTSGQVSNSGEPRIRTAASQSSSSVTSIVYGRNWDIEMENMLKDMYAAIKSQEIRQPAEFQPASSHASMLTPNTPYSTLMRRRSQRGQDRMSGLKRGSIRGLQTLLGQQAGVSPYSSNSSIDGRDPRDGRTSPSPSFATSLDGVPTTSTFFTQALGFASNLSHTIIREAQEDDTRSLMSHNTADTSVSISDEELALLGAPWAKEGMLCRKQYWESTGKRARSKAWQDVFVVIQKGELDMFIFGERGVDAATHVGGGNWLANAHPVGNVVLVHSLAHVLPPPGYNRQRPHCFVLTLASGGVYFFQAGTEDLLNEWVSTCNYWAARQSKEPLSGGVSNMEYGWNRVLDPVSQISTIHDEDSTSIADPSDTFSMRSGKSSRKRSLADTSTFGRSHDRIFINDWKPPMPSTVSSTHDEETQLEALQKQVTLLKTDLQTHNELRSPMSAIYPPRSSNLVKAQSNWEKKSQYLLTEIVKYETYVESLKTAMSLRLKKRGEKALEMALVTASPTQPDFSTSQLDNLSRPHTIVDGNGISIPFTTSSSQHRRERALPNGDDDPTTP